MKKVAILGSTGSIGRSALDVIAGHGDKFRVAGLTARGSVDVLLKQIRQFRPEAVAVYDREAARELRKHTRTEVLEGEEGVCSIAGDGGSDFVLSAIVGFAGLMPTLSAVRAGKTVGLANKESLVVAGEVVTREARQKGARILPVDSEHSAVFQCIEGRDADSIKKIILTASGGPFFGKSKRELENVKPEDALRHPSWSMGRKITVDSATLMNKGFEVIEAHHLFGLSADRIDVIIHPQSILHCIVEFTDGCSVAHMSVPDMKAPIAYSLSYPKRLGGVIPPLDLARAGSLNFSAPDHESFPCLPYAREALSAGGTLPAVLNAANEVAVEAFLKGKIGFMDIPSVIRSTMDAHDNKTVVSLEGVIESDKWARKRAVDACRLLAD